MRTPLVALTIAGLVTSACLADAPTDVPGDNEIPNTPDRGAVFAAIQVLLDGVPCKVDAVDASTSKNLRFLSSATWEKGGTQEIDIRGDLLLAARPSGISLVDISDPLEPRILSEYAESGYPLDVKFSPDNQTALVGVGNGIELVDIRDPEEPARAGKWLFPGSYPGGMPVQNAHMLFAIAIKGEQWVFLAPNTNTGIWILKLEGEPANRKLTFVTTTLPVQGGPLGPHDMVVHFDEAMKKHLLYSADGYHGWSVFDVSDPAQPTLVGGFVRPETGYTHTIQAAKLGSRRIVATIAEVGANFMEIYDASDLRAPVLVATWQVGTVVAAQHNFNIVNGQLYLAHYGQGIWVFDLSELPTGPSGRLIDFKPVAHWKGRPSPGGTPSFWDILLKDGVLYGSDITNGVDVFGYGCVTPGDASFTSYN